jgi:NADP-dependent alcohol dehydrogenase
MIGHELTAMFGIDHGKTLAVLQPAIWEVRKENKREKLLQYAQRVLNITAGSDDEKIDAAIEKTREFFESLGIKTRLSDYDVGPNHIDDIVNALEKMRRTALSETGDLDLETSRQILLKAL